METLMTKYRLKPHAWVLALLMLLVGGGALSAPSVRDKMLEDVQVVKNNGDLFVEVHFSAPLRYRMHFPADKGDELRIQLRAVRVPVSDLDALFRREAVTPPYGDVIALDEVIYEGDIQDGPWLTLRFTRSVSYQVIPGSDYRSVRIIVTGLQ